MKIDEHIKRELENEQAQLDQMLQTDQGLLRMVADTYKGGLGRWMAVATVVAILLTVVMVYTGYQFFIAAGTDDRVFWGVCLIISLFAQSMLKLWSWMEMNRMSLMRSIKHLELALLRSQP